MLWLTVLVDTALIVNTSVATESQTIGTCQRSGIRTCGIDGLAVPAIGQLRRTEAEVRCAGRCWQHRQVECNNGVATGRTSERYGVSAGAVVCLAVPGIW